MKYLKKKNILLTVLAATLCSCGNSFNSASDSLADDSNSVLKPGGGATTIGFFDCPIPLKNGGHLTAYGITFEGGLLKLSVYFEEVSCKATDFSAYLESFNHENSGFIRHTLDGAEGAIKLTLATKLEENWAVNLDHAKMDFLFNISEECVSMIQADFNNDNGTYYYLSTDFGLGPCAIWDDEHEENEGATFKSFYQDLNADYILAGAAEEELPFEFISKSFFNN